MNNNRRQLVLDLSSVSLDIISTDLFGKASRKDAAVQGWITAYWRGTIASDSTRVIFWAKMSLGCSVPETQKGPPFQKKYESCLIVRDNFLILFEIISIISMPFTLSKVSISQGLIQKRKLRQIKCDSVMLPIVLSCSQAWRRLITRSEKSS